MSQGATIILLVAFGSVGSTLLLEAASRLRARRRRRQRERMGYEAEAARVTIDLRDTMDAGEPASPLVWAEGLLEPSDLSELR